MTKNVKARPARKKNGEEHAVSQECQNDKELVYLLHWCGLAKLKPKLLFLFFSFFVSFFLLKGKLAVTCLRFLLPLSVCSFVRPEAIVAALASRAGVF